MKQVTMYRNDDDGQQTLGSWNAVTAIGFICNSLELPWKENQHNISCIPVTKPGKPYKVIWSRSNRLSALSLQRWLSNHPGQTEADCPDEVKNIFTYEVTVVPGRDGIRIHSANYFYELKGCIALGMKLIDVNQDHEQDLSMSKLAVDTFAEKMNHEDFELFVVDNFVSEV